MKIVKIISTLCIIFGILLGIANLPFFVIEEIYINGNNRVTNDEILQAINYVPNEVNYIFLNKDEAKKTLLSNPYVEEVEFVYIFPSEMEINIKEREQIAYVPYGKNSYLYISREGIVLQTSKELLEPMPIIKGVNFSEFTLGNVLINDGEELLKGTVNIINTMKKYDIETKNLIIDIVNPKEIKIKYGDIIINFGYEEEVDKKIRILSGILKSLEDRPELRGEIDISNTSIEPILKVK